MRTGKIAIRSGRWVCAVSMLKAPGQPECASVKTKNTCSGRLRRNAFLYSFNVRDYCRLHGEFLAKDQSHAGIIIAKQQHYSVGEQMRRLLKLIATKPAEEMRNQIDFLSHWQ